MPLLALRRAQLAYGDRPLLDGAELLVEPGERLGLIGRNGTGKSSLLGVIAGLASLDEGEIQRREGLAVRLVTQEPELPDSQGLRAARTSEPRFPEYLQRLGVPPDALPDSPSGGERKRIALALAFAAAPELLLLDEPTNHLDIEGIECLEGLMSRVEASVFVTHDRAFLDRVATRIVELDRGALRSYPGNFGAYERRKSEELEAEASASRRFEKFWAQEEAWIRKGVEARRTRNEGRVRRLERLRAERAARRERIGNVKLRLEAGERSGELVAELEGVSASLGGRRLVESLSMRIQRGDRIGIVGPNGAGKTTLLRLMLGEIAPDAGTVRLGTNLRIAYFDQMRAALDPERSLADTVSPGSDWVELAGERRHVVGYLGDFLFPAQRVRSPVRMLSGGERNRLLLARLFAQPANLLVLDEPTNDLDIESLELLEQTLQEYAGTLLLVSHDRAFLDNVATQTLAAEGDGRWGEYVGGYSEWIAQRPKTRAETAGERPVRGATPAAPAAARVRTKLSFREQRELESLPGDIERMEAEKASLLARMSEPGYHRASAGSLRRDRQRLEEIDSTLATLFGRWEELERLQADLSDR